MLWSKSSGICILAWYTAAPTSEATASQTNIYPVYGRGSNFQLKEVYQTPQYITEAIDDFDSFTVDPQAPFTRVSILTDTNPQERIYQIDLSPQTYEDIQEFEYEIPMTADFYLHKPAVELQVPNLEIYACKGPLCTREFNATQALQPEVFKPIYLEPANEIDSLDPDTLVYVSTPQRIGEAVAMTPESTGQVTIPYSAVGDEDYPNRIPSWRPTEEQDQDRESQEEEQINMYKGAKEQGNRYDIEETEYPVYIENQRYHDEVAPRRTKETAKKGQVVKEKLRSPTANVSEEEEDSELGMQSMEEIQPEEQPQGPTVDQQQPDITELMSVINQVLDSQEMSAEQTTSRLQALQARLREQLLHLRNQGFSMSNLPRLNSSNASNISNEIRKQIIGALERYRGQMNFRNNSISDSPEEKPEKNELETETAPSTQDTQEDEEAGTSYPTEKRERTPKFLQLKEKSESAETEQESMREEPVYPMEHPETVQVKSGETKSKDEETISPYAQQMTSVIQMTGEQKKCVLENSKKEKTQQTAELAQPEQEKQEQNQLLPRVPNKQTDPQTPKDQTQLQTPSHEQPTQYQRPTQLPQQTENSKMSEVRGQAAKLIDEEETRRTVITRTETEIQDAVDVRSRGSLPQQMKIGTADEGVERVKDKDEFLKKIGFSMKKGEKAVATREPEGEYFGDGPDNMRKIQLKTDEANIANQTDVKHVISTSGYTEQADNVTEDSIGDWDDIA